MISNGSGFQGWLFLGLSVFAIQGVQAQRSGRASARPCVTANWSPGERLTGRVINTVDGDTVNITPDKTNKRMPIRMLSIDTPETHFNGLSQGVWGDRAAENLARLLPVGQVVTVELEAEPCDHYGRMLGHVFVGTHNINKQQLEDAMAVNYCIAPNLAHCEEYGNAVRPHIQARDGMFGDSSLALPYEFRRISSHRPFDKYLGSMSTKRVFAPGSYDQVSDVADRVFFMNRADVRAPYRMAIQ